LGAVPSFSLHQATVKFVGEAIERLTTVVPSDPRCDDPVQLTIAARGDKLGSVSRLLGLARSPSGAALIVVASRFKSSEEFRLIGLHLRSADDKEAEKLDFGPASAGGVAAVALGERAALVAQYFRGRIDYLSYALQTGAVNSWSTSSIGRPAIVNGQQGGFLVAWLESEGPGVSLKIQSLDARGEMIGSAAVLDLGRRSASELSLASNAKGRLFAFWTEPAVAKEPTGSRILNACEASVELGAQTCRILEITREGEAFRGRYSVACGASDCWAAWIDRAFRLREVSADRRVVDEKSISIEFRGKDARLPAIAASRGEVWALWNEISERGGWELRGKLVSLRENRDLSIGGSGRPTDSPWFEVAGSATDALVTWLDEGTLRFEVLRSYERSPG